MMKEAVARSVRVHPGPLANDGGSDLESRKRRIIRRGPLGTAASQGSQTALMDAGMIHRVSKGKLLLKEADVAGHVALLSLGRVRMFRTLSDGHALSLGYRGAGDLIGEAAIGGSPTYRESAVAIEDVEALLVPVATLRAVMTADHAFSQALVSLLVDRRTDTEDRLASVLFRNVEARLAEFLLRSAQRWGIPDPRGVLVSAPFTHQEMANMIGSTRETVTLTLGDLRRKGLIEIDRRRIVVLDREALKSRVA